MIKSMTGYGRAQQVIGSRDITVEIKSVNHRFFEFSSRIPRIYGYLEEKLKNHLQGSISRGKVDVGVTIFTTEVPNISVEVNGDLAHAYVGALRQLGQKEGLVDDLSISSMIRIADIFNIRKIQEDEEEIWEAVRQVADEALQRFIEMREKEGEKLKVDVLSRLNVIEDLSRQVTERNPKTVEDYRNKLYAKLSELLEDRNIDEQRILTEAAIFSEKIAVEEETVRLDSHIHQFREILESSHPVGRKLDFLVQELNRETNTIGSKAQDLAITRMVVDIKSEIEKIREQIQNIE